MPTPELNAKGLRAYAVYFVAHFAQLFVPTLLLQVLTGAHWVGQLGVVLSWGWALYRLTVRFFRGQGRIPTRAEGRQLAITGALYSATLVTAVKGAVVAYLTFNTPAPQEVSLALWLAVGFVVSVFMNALTIGVYLLPFVQERAFAHWRERNP